MRQTVETTEQMRQVRSEGAYGQLHVSQYHVAQLLKKGAPSPMVCQYTRVQHLRRGQHETRQRLLDSTAFCARGITIIYGDAQTVFWRQGSVPGCKSTALGECTWLVRKDIEGVAALLYRQRLIHGQEAHHTTARPSGSHQADMPSLAQEVESLPLGLCQACNALGRSQGREPGRQKGRQCLVRQRPRQQGALLAYEAP
jgi:hypothetical protein